MTGEQLLGELVKRKIMKPEVVQRLQREISASGKSAEDLIYEKRIADDIKIAQAKAEILGVPYREIDATAIPKEILELIPEETVRTYAVVPIEKKDELFVVGMMHPDDIKAQEALRFIANQNHFNLGVYLISYTDWQGVIRTYSPYRSGIEEAVKAMNLKPGENSARRLVSMDASNLGAEDAPIIKMVAETFKEAVQIRASDVHFEPQEDYLRIRFRINGDLREVASLPPELSSIVISRIKVMSNLKIDENRVPQDGRFRSKILDREIDFRVATFPTPMGEKVAVRVLDPSTGLRTFDHLGLTGRNLQVVKDSLNKPYGMILITGPTGSGKSTTLYTLLQTLNTEDVNIVSLEDPVEYFVSGINQSQVRPEIGYDFAAGLRQILRQDPDIIMVGEIRDAETATLAVQAALTGHIVLSTLHTNNAAGVIPRLMDMKVDSYLLPVALNMMLAQRLIGVLCPDCKKAEPAPPAMVELIEKALQDVEAVEKEQLSKPYQIYHAPGCAQCHFRGIVDRVAIYEILSMTSGLQEVINNKPTLNKVWEEAKAQKMVPLRGDGVLKALKGIVSMEEVLRTTEDA